MPPQQPRGFKLRQGRWRSLRRSALSPSQGRDAPGSWARLLPAILFLPWPFISRSGDLDSSKTPRKDELEAAVDAVPAPLSCFIYNYYLRLGAKGHQRFKGTAGRSGGFHFGSSRRLSLLALATVAATVVVMVLLCRQTRPAPSLHFPCHTTSDAGTQGVPVGNTTRCSKLQQKPTEALPAGTGASTYAVPSSSSPHTLIQAPTHSSLVPWQQSIPLPLLAPPEDKHPPQPTLPANSSTAANSTKPVSASIALPINSTVRVEMPPLSPLEAQKQQVHPPLPQLLLLTPSPAPQLRQPLASDSPTPVVDLLGNSAPPPAAISEPSQRARTSEARGQRPAKNNPELPGSRFTMPQEVAAFRRRLSCATTEGQWKLDPTPRLLPWPHDQRHFGHCERRWRRVGHGLTPEAADEVVLNKAPPEGWNIRESAKLVWQVDAKKCGLSAVLGPFHPHEAVKVLLSRGGSSNSGQGNGSSSGAGGSANSSEELGGAGRSERVILVVGDSMQNALAMSLVDHMRMGLGREEVVPLVGSTLPCYVPKMDHRGLCWGVHFFASSNPGLKLVFVRNDYISNTEQYTCDRTKVHFQVPWLKTLETLRSGNYSWQEGGNLGSQPNGTDANQVSPCAKGPITLPPVVILNRGAHFAEDSVFFPQLNDTMRAAREACSDCLLVYRNTPGGHKGCTTFAPLLQRRPSELNLPFNWGKIAAQSRNPLNRQIVERWGGVFLDVETMTSLRADSHLKARGKDDCLHYCAPGPVDTWAQLLVNVLKHTLS